MRASLICMLLVVGCAAEDPPVARPRSPYGCAGPTELAVAPAHPPSGRVEVKVLGESPDGTRLSVLAEGASASQLAVRIGEALHAVTRVDPELELVPVSVYFPDITIDVLGAMLRVSKVRVLRPEWNKDRVLVFHATDPLDQGPIETHLIAATPAMSPDQIAGLFCRSAASSAGWAQVVGQRVMVSDHRSNLDRFDHVIAGVVPMATEPVKKPVRSAAR